MLDKGDVENLERGFYGLSGFVRIFMCADFWWFKNTQWWG